MACFFVDIDGTLMQWGTEKFLPNARETVEYWIDQGHQVIFTTLRRVNESQKLIQTLNETFGERVIIFSVPSPRFVINDDGAFAVKHLADAGWPVSYMHLGERI